MHDGSRMTRSKVKVKVTTHKTFKVGNSSNFFNFQNLSPPAFLM